MTRRGRGAREQRSAIDRVPSRRLVRSAGFQKCFALRSPCLIHWIAPVPDGLRNANDALLPPQGRHPESPVTALASRFSSIRARLVLLVASVFLPLFLLSAFIAVRYADAERRVVEARRYDVANNLAGLLQRDTERISAVLRTLAVSPDLAEGRLELFRRHAEAAVKVANLDAVALSDASGGELFSTANAPARPPRAVRLPSGALDGPATISGVTAWGDGSKPIFVVSVPVAREGHALQSLTAAVSVERLRGVFEEAGMSRDWIAAIVDANGKFLARSRESRSVLDTRRTTSDRQASAHRG